MNKTQDMAELKYKVGDRVQIKNFDWFRNEGTNMLAVYMTKYYGEVVTIKSAHKGFYRIKEDGGQYCWIDEMFECKMDEESIIDLTVKGEEVKERIEITIPEGYEYVIESGKIIFTKKKKEYPKTYEECCRVLGISDGEFMFSGLSDDEYDLFDSFVVIKRCRDAYWKIAGEEMGLGKPWEPDWREKRYVIYRNQEDIIGGYREAGYVEHHIFEFPTKEMRDAFRENFGSDIEFCKEFL